MPDKPTSHFPAPGFRGLQRNGHEREGREGIKKNECSHLSRNRQISQCLFLLLYSFQLLPWQLSGTGVLRMRRLGEQCLTAISEPISASLPE